LLDVLVSAVYDFLRQPIHLTTSDSFFRRRQNLKLGHKLTGRWQATGMRKMLRSRTDPTSNQLTGLSGNGLLFANLKPEKCGSICHITTIVYPKYANLRRRKCVHRALDGFLNHCFCSLEHEEGLWCRRECRTSSLNRKAERRSH